MKNRKVIKLADYGTPDVRRQAGEQLKYDERSAKEGLALRARVVPPIEYLNSRGWITDNQMAAGNRLAISFYDAGLIKATNCDLLKVQGGKQDYSSKQAQAMEEFNRAMRSIGPLADCAYEICILECSVTRWQNGQRISKGGGIAIVRLMLQALADHYGIEKPKNHPKNHPKK